MDSQKNLRWRKNRRAELAKIGRSESGVEEKAWRGIDIRQRIQRRIADKATQETG